MPRLDPLPRDQWPEDLRSILGVVPEGFSTALGENNIFSTLARNPELFKVWLPLARPPAGRRAALGRGPRAVDPAHGGVHRLVV